MEYYNCAKFNLLSISGPDFMGYEASSPSPPHPHPHRAGECQKSLGLLGLTTKIILLFGQEIFFWFYVFFFLKTRIQDFAVTLSFLVNLTIYISVLSLNKSRNSQK